MGNWNAITGNDSIPFKDYKNESSTGKFASFHSPSSRFFYCHHKSYKLKAQDVRQPNCASSCGYWEISKSCPVTFWFLRWMPHPVKLRNQLKLRSRLATFLVPNYVPSSKNSLTTSTTVASLQIVVGGYFNKFVSGESCIRKNCEAAKNDSLSCYSLPPVVSFQLERIELEHGGLKVIRRETFLLKEREL
ncbi:hypothetical protein NC652_012445 [Populus alba x Populus x berolinensis]|nr:hypothetical protein NC652_012445 [Populus alba x Populus x berolinensis]